MITNMYEKRITVSHHHEKVVVKIDLNHLEEGEFDVFLGQVYNTMKTTHEQFGQLIYSIFCVKEAQATPKIMKALADYNKKVRTLPIHEVVIGVSGFKKALLKMHNKLTKADVVPLDSEQAAFEYIAQHQV